MMFVDGVVALEQLMTGMIFTLLLLPGLLLLFSIVLVAVYRGVRKGRGRREE